MGPKRKVSPKGLECFCGGRVKGACMCESAHFWLGWLGLAAAHAVQQPSEVHTAELRRAYEGMIVWFPQNAVEAR